MKTTYNELTEKPAVSSAAPQVDVSERPKVEEISEEEYKREKNNEKKKENKKSSESEKKEKDDDLNNID